MGQAPRVMKQIIQQEGHFVMMVKKNQPVSYDEIVQRFEAIKEERKRMKSEQDYKTMYPERMEKYDEAFHKKRTGTDMNIVTIGS